MSSVLKGNFETKKTVNVAEERKEDETVETRFEREALKRLGGSIAFVSKKKVMWDAQPVAKGGTPSAAAVASAEARKAAEDAKE